MNRRSAIVITVLIALLLTPGAASAATQDVSSATYESVVVDALIARPLGLVSTAFGSAVFALTYPFTICGDKADIAHNARILVFEPAAYTFSRPWGQFDWQPGNRE